LEVEKKSATPYFFKRTRERLRKAEGHYFFQSLLSPPRPLWALTGTKEEWKNIQGDNNIGYDDVSKSLMTAMEKTTSNHLLSGCSNRNVSTFSAKAASAVREVADVFRIMVCLHSAKDFPSVLRLCRIETVRGPNEK
jgi:hypothetical protein